MPQYTLYHDLTGDGDEQFKLARFTFEASDQADADQKAASWAQHHGFDTRDVEARLSQGRELAWTAHNEYVD